VRGGGWPHDPLAAIARLIAGRDTARRGGHLDIHNKETTLKRYQRLALVLTALGLIASQPSAATDNALYLAGFGGGMEEVFRKETLPPFEKANNVKVEYVVDRQGRWPEDKAISFWR
jgi:hypothetical protein